MNNDLAGDSAVWRALLGVHGGRFCCFICVLVVLCQRAAEDVLRRMLGPSLETDAIFDAVLSVNYCAILIGCL